MTRCSYPYRASQPICSSTSVVTDGSSHPAASPVSSGSYSIDTLQYTCVHCQWTGPGHDSTFVAALGPLQQTSRLYQHEISGDRGQYAQRASPSELKRYSQDRNLLLHVPSYVKTSCGQMQMLPYGHGQGSLALVQPNLVSRWVYCVSFLLHMLESPGHRRQPIESVALFILVYFTK